MCMPHVKQTLVCDSARMEVFKLSSVQNQRLNTVVTKMNDHHEDCACCRWMPLDRILCAVPRDATIFHGVWVFSGIRKWTGLRFVEQFACWLFCAVFGG